MPTLASSPGGKRREQAALKVIFCILILAIFANNSRLMLSWSERRGVSDDLCYLRQAHLFERFGLISGLDTDLARDDDHFFETAVRDVGHPEWGDQAKPTCHTPMASGKRVIQYPPGTGLVLAMFPPGHQVAFMYIAASGLILALACAAIVAARSTTTILASGALGAAAIYFMINPSRASYSIAPTVALCAMMGAITVAYLFDPKPYRAVAGSLLIGAMVGLSINFRIPNILLCTGYLAVLGAALLSQRRLAQLMQCIVFGIGLVVFALPTLVANEINAGGPLKTTYGDQDVTAPGWLLPSAQYYFSNMQGWLALIALGWALWYALFSPSPRIKLSGAATAITMLCNLAFFLSHTLSTPYYLMPAITLAFATLLCALLAEQRRPACSPALGAP
jgi:hypothetical protein